MMHGPVDIRITFHVCVHVSKWIMKNLCGCDVALSAVYRHACSQSVVRKECVVYKTSFFKKPCVTLCCIIVWYVGGRIAQ